MDTELNETSIVFQAIRDAGGPSAMARELGLTPWAVSKWVTTGLPANRVLWLAERTGWKYTPHSLAPGIYPNPTDGLPQEWRGAAA